MLITDEMTTLQATEESAPDLIDAIYIARIAIVRGEQAHRER